MASYRPARVGELIQSELATLITRGLKDPRLAMSTVSFVDVSPDLRQRLLPGILIMVSLATLGYVYLSDWQPPEQPDLSASYRA